MAKVVGFDDDEMQAEKMLLENIEARFYRKVGSGYIVYEYDSGEW